MTERNTQCSQRCCTSTLHFLTLNVAWLSRHCSSDHCAWDIFRWTWDLKSATWSLDHKDQHTWIWKWLTSGLGRYKASNISTLWILLLRPIIVTLPFNCSAPRDHNSTRLQTKKDFSHMSVFSKSQLSSPNRLGDIGTWSLCNGAQCTRVSPKGKINCEIKGI